MRIRPIHLLVAAFLACLPAVPVIAAQDAGQATPGPAAAPGLTAIPDPELALMRGRYTVGDNAVAWFGVSMISTWQTASGQTLQSTLALGMDFSQSQTPTISFTPTVSITAADAAMPETSGVVRSVDASGLANVSGMTQSVQVAGDGNRANNITQLNVRDGSAPAGAATGIGANAAQNQGNALASASFQDNSASVLLAIDGQGAVRQWIGNGGLGQSIQLTADNQQVSNQLQIDLVRQSLAANVQLSQNVAQAINLTRGIPGGY
ncbi:MULTISPECIES: hypothetical protein [unclassified Lysobacter]